MEVFVSNDGTNFTALGLTDDFNENIKKPEKGMMKVAFTTTNTRYVKVVVTNWGNIPKGNPGEGNKAWLLVDEIEIN